MFLIGVSILMACHMRLKKLNCSSHIAGESDNTLSNCRWHKTYVRHHVKMRPLPDFGKHLISSKKHRIFPKCFYNGGLGKIKHAVPLNFSQNVIIILQWALSVNAWLKFEVSDVNKCVSCRGVCRAGDGHEQF